MAKSKTQPTTAAEKEVFRTPLLERIFEAHGDGTETLKAAEVSRPTAHRWKNAGYALPDAFQLRLMARAKKVSECWLAFGVGPRDAVAAQLGQNIGEKFQNDPDLAHICHAWSLASEADKAVLKIWASKFPRPKINPLLTPPPPPKPPPAATLSSEQPKSSKPPLAPEELVLILGYLSDVTESSLAEKPLLVAFERLATFLAPLTLSQKSDGHVGGSDEVGDSSDTDAPNDEADEPPA